MSKYEMIKLFYIRGQWTETMVRNVVIKGWISEKECEDILSSCEALREQIRKLESGIAE